MRLHDSSLDRLFRAAARAPRPAPEACVLPWTREAHVLGEWRKARSKASSDGWLGLYRTGLALAGATALVAVLFTWRSDDSRSADELATIHAEFNVAVLR